MKNYIRTKFIGATNTKQSRIRIYDIKFGTSKIINFNHQYKDVVNQIEETMNYQHIFSDNNFHYFEEK